MKKRKHRKYPLFIITFGLLTVFVAVVVCSVSIRRNLVNEMEKTLQDVAAQNVLVIENEIRMQCRLMEGFSKELSGHPEKEAQILEEMGAFVESYGFKRMCIAHRDGTANTTDGYQVSIGDMSFFQKGMEGEIWITTSMEDRVDQSEKINVLSVPYYNEKQEVEGVVYAVYRNEVFQNMLDVDFFDGQGFSCVITMSGDVMVHSQNSPISGEENFFEHLTMDAQGDSEPVREMQAVMQRSGSDFGYCGNAHENGDASIFYYMPLNEGIYDVQWYMLAIVPETMMTRRMDPVIRDVRTLAAVLVIIAVIGVGFYVYIERRRREELLSLAYEDRLTGGYNFASFRENAKLRENLAGYVIAMDLAEFKLVNNSFGVQKGDETLLELWKTLRREVGDTEMVARANADRFVLFWQAKDRAALEERLKRLIADIEKIPDRLGIPAVFPVFGIYYTDALDEPDKYYSYAVQAKHLVKGRRDRQYAFYDEIDYKQLVENRRLEDHFREDLQQGRFEVWYQPKYCAQDERVIGAEALVRWRRRDGKILSPGLFIPLFEKNGNIAVLDEYIFRKVCEQQKNWLDEGRKVVPVSVNISRVSLYFGNIVERYESILHSYELDTKYVQLEITESATVDKAGIGDLIERFHQAGFAMLLDDFGSGYSSLASLNTMHFDILKLDKSLIDYIGDEKGEKLLKYITKLGQSLGLQITAEGMETEKQLVFMRDLKCDDIQGYYFSKPLVLADYEELLFP